MGIEAGRRELPAEFEIFSAYPNPFNSTLQLDFSIPEVSNVVLAIYNLAGREVRRWEWNQPEAGVYAMSWDVGSGEFSEIGSGIYFCRLSYGARSEVRKILLVR